MKSRIKAPKTYSECRVCGRKVELTVLGKLKSHSVGGISGFRTRGMNVRFKVPRCAGSGCDPR